MKCLEMQSDLGNCMSLCNYPIMVTNNGQDNNQFKNSGSMEEQNFSTYKAFFKKRLQLHNGFTI